MTDEEQIALLQWKVDTKRYLREAFPTALEVGAEAFDGVADRCIGVTFARNGDGRKTRMAVRLSGCNPASEVAAIRKWAVENRLIEVEVA